MLPMFVRGAEDDDGDVRVRGNESPSRLDTGLDGSLRADEHDIDRLPGEPGQQFVSVGDGLDVGQSCIADSRGVGRRGRCDVIADENSRHGGCFLWLGDGATGSTASSCRYPTTRRARRHHPDGAITGCCA